MRSDVYPASSTGGTPSSPGIDPVFGTARIVTVSSLAGAAVVRFDRARLARRVSVWLIPAFVGLAALLIFVAERTRHLSPWGLAGVVVSAGLVGALVFYVIVVLSNAYAVLLENRGVTVYFSMASPWKFREVTFPWRDFERVAVNSGGTDVGFVSDKWGAIVLPAELARVVLSDERCPLYGHVPDDISSKISARSPSRLDSA